MDRGTHADFVIISRYTISDQAPELTIWLDRGQSLKLVQQEQVAAQDDRRKRSKSSFQCLSDENAEERGRPERSVPRTHDCRGLILPTLPLDASLVSLMDTLRSSCSSLYPPIFPGGEDPTTRQMLVLLICGMLFGQPSPAATRSLSPTAEVKRARH